MNESEGQIPGGSGGGDSFRGAPRRRGRRGRGAPAPFRTPGPPMRGPQGGPPAPRAHDEEGGQQASEIAAYERRQMRQQNRGWRPPTTFGGSSTRPTGPGRPGGFAPRPGGFAPRPGGAGFRPGGQGFRPPGQGFRPASPGGGGRPMGGARPVGRGRPMGGYQDQMRRATGGPAAITADAGEPLAGPHAVLEAIRSGRAVRKLYVSQDRGTRTGAVNDLITEAQGKRIFVNYVDKLDLARMSPIEEHQGVVAIVEGRKGVDLDELMLHLETVEDSPLVLIVDSLQDPQNFGVLLRSAEGAGVDGVVIPRHRAVGITAAVGKTSAGATEHLMVADVANLRQAIDALKEKGIWVIGADESGEMLYDEADYRGATAIVIGGEGEGIRRLVLEGCDEVVRIPMAGKVSSLNAAAAGTVLLYEALRQRSRDAAPPGTRTPRPEQPAAAVPEIGRDDRDEGDAREELDHSPEAAASAAEDEAGGEWNDVQQDDGTAEPAEQTAPADAALAAPTAGPGEDDSAAAPDVPSDGPAATDPSQDAAPAKPKRKSTASKTSATKTTTPRKRTTKPKE